MLTSLLATYWPVPHCWKGLIFHSPLSCMEQPFLSVFVISILECYITVALLLFYLEGSLNLKISLWQLWRKVLKFNMLITYSMEWNILAGVIFGRIHYFWDWRIIIRRTNLEWTLYMNIHNTTVTHWRNFFLMHPPIRQINFSANISCHTVSCHYYVSQIQFQMVLQKGSWWKFQKDKWIFPGLFQQWLYVMVTSLATPCTVLPPLPPSH